MSIVQRCCIISRTAVGRAPPTVLFCLGIKRHASMSVTWGMLPDIVVVYTGVVSETSRLGESACGFSSASFFIVSALSSASSDFSRTCAAPLMLPCPYRASIAYAISRSARLCRLAENSLALAGSSLSLPSNLPTIELIRSHLRLESMMSVREMLGSCLTSLQAALLGPGPSCHAAAREAFSSSI